MATIIICITIVCLCSWISSLGKWNYVGTDTVPSVEPSIAYYVAPPGVATMIACAILLTIMLGYAIYAMPTCESLGC